jgi:AmmeMemoRadiSam system protein A
MLTLLQRQTLLKIARDAIAGMFEGRRPTGDLVDDEVLRRPAGAFVTLNTRDGDLRGCVGSILPVAPLCQAVAESAVNAAFRDPRFRPLSREELAGIHLEISVMGPIEPVASVEDIVVGRDGLIIRRGHQAGLLLPQVATEYGWDRETFLSQTCIKAGLPRDAWQRPGTTIEYFSAEVFGEPQIAE